jgi:hypothetical protein
MKDGNKTNIKEPLTVSKLKLLKVSHKKRSTTPALEYATLQTPVRDKRSSKGVIEKQKPQTARGGPVESISNKQFQFMRMNTVETIDDSYIKEVEVKPIPTTNQKEKPKVKILHSQNTINKRTITASKRTIEPSSISIINENVMENRKRDENEVKRLNIWEKDVLNQDMYNDPNFQNSKKELECINWKNNIRDALAKINSTSNVFYQDIVQSGEREQGSMLFQNINITKKKFQFDLFRDDPSAKKKSSKNILGGDKEVTEGDEVMEKYQTLKQDANYENIIRTDYYREIIKEKIKLEMTYTKELNILAQKIFDLKSRKMALSHDIFEIINYLKDLEKDFEVIVFLNKRKKKKPSQTTNARSKNSTTSYNTALKRKCGIKTQIVPS